MKKYVLCPGEVQSRCDGDWHYIGAARLAQLYKVKMRDCIVYSEERLTGYTEEQKERLIWLHPQYSGNCSLPKTLFEISPLCNE